MEIIEQSKKDNNGKIIIALMFVQVVTVLPFAVLSIFIEPMTLDLKVDISQSGIFFGVGGLGASVGWFFGGWLLNYINRQRLFFLVLSLDKVYY